MICSNSSNYNRGGLINQENIWVEAEDREKRLQTLYGKQRIEQINSGLFKESKIVSSVLNKSKKIFYSIPHLDRALHKAQLLARFDKSSRVQPIDLIKLLKNEKHPSLFLMKIGTEIIAAFASEGFKDHPGKFGDDSCFIASLTRDNLYRPTISEISGSKCFIWHNDYSLSFGDTDLVFKQNVLES